MFCCGVYKCRVWFITSREAQPFLSSLRWGTDGRFRVPTSKNVSQLSKSVVANVGSAFVFFINTMITVEVSISFLIFFYNSPSNFNFKFSVALTLSSI